MTQDKEFAIQIVNQLKQLYPDAVCALEYEQSPWKLLVMARLSAQCTDARVNIVSKELFKKYPDPRAMADADLSELEAILKPCGLYHAKAANIKDASRMLLTDFHGTLPDNMEDLLKMPGVGRKIANLLLGDIFHKPAIVTDTHCIRICGRLGFYPETLKDPYKVEMILTPLIPPEESSDFCHRLVLFGRDICRAQSPSCQRCPLSSKCLHYCSKKDEP